MKYAPPPFCFVLAVCALACSRDERKAPGPSQSATPPSAAVGTVTRSATSDGARQSGLPSFDHYDGPYCEHVCWSSPLTADVNEARASEAGLRCSNRQCCSWFCY